MIGPAALREQELLGCSEVADRSGKTCKAR